LLLKATSVEYVFKIQDLRKQTESTRLFRENRLQNNKHLQEIVREKSQSYIDGIYSIYKRESDKYPNLMQSLFDLLKIDKTLDILNNRSK